MRRPPVAAAPQARRRAVWGAGGGAWRGGGGTRGGGLVLAAVAVGVEAALIRYTAHNCMMPLILKPGLRTVGIDWREVVGVG